MELVTGRAGQAHITSAQLGAGYASITGIGQYVTRNGSMFTATVVDANTVRIADGDAWMNGRHATIPHGTHEDIALDSGSAGTKRNDLIVIRYTKDASTDIETASLVVIKGTPTSDTPADPAYNSGTILNGALIVDMPLWRIPISGITPGTPVALFQVLDPMDRMQQDIDGKAASSHSHAASAISSGTLGVARGGTGKATHTANSVLTGNGTNAVNNVSSASGALYATAANGAPKFGTLPVAQGGTGSTTASGALSALGAAAASHNHGAGNITSGTLSVARGGTGAATASANRVFAGPASGSAAAPSFRALAAADIPDISAAKLTSGSLPVARLALSTPTFTAGSFTLVSWNSCQRGGTVILSFDGKTTVQVPAWSNSKVSIGTVSVKPPSWTQITCIAQNYDTLVPVLCGIDTGGKIWLRTAADAVPANTWLWVHGSYVVA